MPWVVSSQLLLCLGKQLANNISIQHSEQRLLLRPAAHALNWPVSCWSAVCADVSAVVCVLCTLAGYEGTFVCEPDNHKALEMYKEWKSGKKPSS